MVSAVARSKAVVLLLLLSICLLLLSLCIGDLYLVLVLLCSTSILSSFAIISLKKRVGCSTLIVPVDAIFLVFFLVVP